MNPELKRRAAQFFSKKLLLPFGLFAFQVIFLILYGTLVEYDSGANSSQVTSLDAELRTYPFFQDVHVMAFVGFGFLVTFLRRYGYSSVGFNLLLAAFAIQWSTITNGLFTFIEQAQNGIDTLKIQVSLQSLIGSDFAAIAVLITMGALLGRASPLQLIIIAFFELMFYSANQAINTYVLEAADIGGSMTVHAFGAYFGLAASVILFRKKAIDNPKKSSVYHSDIFAMIGTVFLWVFWPSFNGALAVGTGQYRAIINTYFAMTGSVIATFLFSMLFHPQKHFTMVQVQSATLAGGVAVGAIANMVIQPWGAILVGFLAGMVSVIGIQFLTPMMNRFLYLQDTRGVHNLHGMPGLFSGIASAVAAGVAEVMSSENKVAYGDSLYQVFPARENRHAGTQAGYQLALLVVTVLVAVLGGLLTGIVARIPIFLPLSDKELFDDEPYWMLPDDADNYLPTSIDREDEEDEPHGKEKLELEVFAPRASDEDEAIKEYVLKNEGVESDNEFEDQSEDGEVKVEVEVH